MYDHLREDEDQINIEMFSKELKVYYCAIKDIEKGEELFIDYGDEYWSTRKYTNIKPTTNLLHQ